MARENVSPTLKRGDNASERGRDAIELQQSFHVDHRRKNTRIRLPNHFPLISSYE